MRVIGTAGHVDHGKSTLVKAISGIDLDRLREEKERGMTIDLGFAWLILPSGEKISIVDVPGHIDFIKNMLAGVGSIDAAVLVIAADEGPMPQTREHLDILNLLQVSAGVVAVSKIDMVTDADWLELVQADIAETIAGTVLAAAPIIPVSAVTGQGIPQLLAALSSVLLHSPSRPDKGRPRLGVDRIFTISGFGTVVTGTLLDGYLTVGQEVEILPTGIKTRIRGLQLHNHAADQAGPGSRVAINLMNISTAALHRGDVVTIPGWLEPSQLVDVRIRCLPQSPQPLKHNQQVDFFIGAVEVPAYLRLLGTREILPGEEGWVQLRLARRVPVVKGDRFIIRRPSPGVTIGGGLIVDPLPRRRHRRFRPEVISRLETLAHGTPQELILQLLDRLGPVVVKELPAKTTLLAMALQATLTDLLATGEVLLVAGGEELVLPPTLMASKLVIASKVGWQAMREQFRQILSAYHLANPLRIGMPHGELKSRLKAETGLFNKLIEQARLDGLIKTTAATVALIDHQPQFTSLQRQAADLLLKRFAADPYATPSAKESLAALNGDEEVLNALVEMGSLLRLSAEVLLLPDTFTHFVGWLRAYLAANGTVTVARVRDGVNTSRKYALALLEYTDAQGITRRIGDERTLRN